MSLWGAHLRMSFYYLATPYRAYPHGLDAAAEAAERLAASLLDLGVEVYSPIAHSHNIARHVLSAPPISDYWLERQKPFLCACVGVIVATQLEGWDSSSGIEFEIDFARRANKPVLDGLLNPMPPKP